MNKKIINAAILVIIALLICVIPIPDSGVKLWFFFEDIDESDIDNDEFKVYYTTYESPVMSENQTVYGQYDIENKRVSFSFDAEIVDDVQILRVDFPAKGQTIIVNQMAVSSAGAIKRNIDPSRFIDDANLILKNDISGYSAVTATCETVIVTGHEDPYIVLGEAATKYIMKCQSNHILTRALLMTLYLLGVLCFKKIKWQN